MSASDELAAVIDGTDLLGCGCCGASTEIKTGPDEFDVDYPARSEALAHAILAAGYSKPRTISTAEELDGLPEGTRIVDIAELLTLEETSMECLEWVDRHGNACHVELPATVLYTPKES